MTEVDPRTAWRIALGVAVELLDGHGYQLKQANSYRGKPHRRAEEDALMLRDLANKLWTLRQRDPAEFLAGEPARTHWERECYGQRAEAASMTEHVTIGDREFRRGAIYRHRRLPGSQLRLMSTAESPHGLMTVYWTSVTTGVTYLCRPEQWLDIAGEEIEQP
jgi:hypothetical protein